MRSRRVLASRALRFAQAGLVLGFLLLAGRVEALEPKDVGAEAEARTGTQANARIVNSLAIQKTQDLDLGQVRAGSSAGTVSVGVLPSGSGGRSATGGVALSGSSFSAAQFQVTTSGGAARVQVSLPAAVTLSRIGGAETIVVRDFRASLQSSCSQGSTCTGAVLFVGASLQVGAEQAGGSYAGTFTVTVNQF